MLMSISTQVIPLIFLKIQVPLSILFPGTTLYLVLPKPCSRARPKRLSHSARSSTFYGHLIIVMTLDGFSNDQIIIHVRLAAAAVAGVCKLKLCGLAGSP